VVEHLVLVDDEYSVLVDVTIVSQAVVQNVEEVVEHLVEVEDEYSVDVDVTIVSHAVVQ
jgi:hypothetical protein